MKEKKSDAKLDDKERIKRWTCEFCEKIYVVPDLARMCENKHLEEDYLND